MLNASNAMRNQVAKRIEKNWGEAGSFLYQTGMSMADFLLSAAASCGNSAVAMTIMGTSAAADTVLDAKERGLTDGQAILLGVLAGTAEAATEKFSLDAMLGKTQWSKSAIGHLLSNILAEGSEEMASEVLNTFADILVSQDKSDWQRTINNYVALGYSKKDAFSKAVADKAREVGLAGLGGAISGGAIGSVGSVRLAINEHNEANVRAAVRAVMESGGSAARSAAAKLQEMLDAGQLPTKENLKTLEAAQVLDDLNRRIAEKNKTAEPEGAAVENDGKLVLPKAEESMGIVAGNKGESAEVIKKLNASIPTLSNISPVASVESRTIDAVQGGTMAERARVLFERIKGIVARPGFGDVEINKRSVKDDLSHGVGYAKAAVIEAIPAVIQNGRQIDFQEKWKGGPDSYIFAAPVLLDGKTVYLAAIVKQSTKNRFYLHEVIDSDGNIIKINNGERANQTSLAAVSSTGTQSPLSATSISENDGNDNTNFKAEKNKTAAQEGTAVEQYAIGRTAGNEPFVIVENDILNEVPEEKWADTVKNNLKTRFPDGITVGKNKIAIDKQSRKEMTYSQYTRWLQKHDPTIRADKFRATDHVDEILSATTDWVNEGLHHPRKDNISDFARGKVLLQIGGNDYFADVVVGTRETGEMLLYDLLNLTPTSISKKETSTAIAENPSPGADRSTAPFSSPIIPTSSENGNTENSERVPGLYGYAGVAPANMQNKTAEPEGAAVEQYALADQKQPTFEDVAAKKPMTVTDIGVNAAGKSFADLQADAQRTAEEKGWLQEPLHNEDTDSLWFVSEATFTHARNSVQKEGVNEEGTLLALAHLDKIVRDARLTAVNDPKNTAKAESRVHTFFAAVRQNGKVLPVKMQVKEYAPSGMYQLPQNVQRYVDTHGAISEYGKLYDVVALEVLGEGKETPGATGEVPGKNAGLLTTPSVSEISVAELLALVNGDAAKYIPKQSGVDGKRVPGLYGYAGVAPARWHQVRTAEQLAKRFGVELRVSEFENGAFGSYKDGVITISPNTADPVMSVLVHELTHHMEKSGLYGEFASAILDYAETVEGEDLDAMRDALKKQYAQKGVTLTEDGVNRELVAKCAQKYLFRDEAAIRRLVRAKPTIGERILNWIRKNLHLFEGTPQEQLIRNAETLYKRALEDAARNSVENTGETEHLIKTLPDGKVFVQASRRVITGTTKAEIKRDITKFFNELLRENGRLEIPTLDGRVLTLTMDETEYKARDDHRTEHGKRVLMTDDEFALKARVEAHIDEIAEVSTLKNPAPVQDKKNHPFARGGFTYPVAFFRDFDGKYYRVTLSVGHDGTVATVYNVGLIDKSDLPAVKNITATGSKAIGKSLSGDSIRNPAEKSNRENSKASSAEQYDLGGPVAVLKDSAYQKRLQEEIDLRSDPEYQKTLLVTQGLDALKANEKEVKLLQKKLERLEKKPAEQKAKKPAAKPVAPSKPISSSRDLRNSLLNLFSMPQEQRGELNKYIDHLAEKLLKNGEVTDADRSRLFDILYAEGVVQVESDEYYDDMERKVEYALKAFAEKAKLEVKLRDRTGVQIAKERERHRESAERARRERDLRELQKKTLKQLQWLSRNRNRAPEDLRETWEEVLGDIDLFAVGAADEMRWSDKYQATWRDLANMYKQAKENDPNFLPSKELEKIVMRLDGDKIADMDISALQDLYRAAIGLRTEFYNRNNVIADEERRLFADAYAEVKQDIGAAKGKFSGKKLDKLFNLQQLTPMNVLQRMVGWKKDGAWMSFARQLEKGERDMQGYTVEANRLLEDFLNEHKDWVQKADGQGEDGIWYEVKVPELVSMTWGNPAAQGQKNTAGAGGLRGNIPMGEKAAEIRYDRQWHGEIVDVLRENFQKFSSMDTVAKLSGKEFQKTASDTRSLRQKVIDFFDSLDNKVRRNGFGEIELNAAGAHDSTFHGYGPVKSATYAALPYVLESGVQIKHTLPYEGHEYDSFLIAAPVQLGEEVVYVGALVIRDANVQRYKLHEVLTIKKDGTVAFQSGTLAEGDSRATEPSSVTSISDSSEKSNRGLQTVFGETHTVLQKDGQKNTAQGGKISGIKPYNQHQINNWSNSKKIVIYDGPGSLVSFVEDAKAKKNLEKKLYFGTVDKHLAEYVLNATGVDIYGRNITLRAGNIPKIFKSHGSEKTEAPRGQRPIIEDDFSIIPDVIGMPDHVARSQKDYDGKPTLEFSKIVDGSKVTIVAVDSGGSLDLFVQTMYAGTKNGSIANATNAKALVITPETPVGTAPDLSIPETFGKSNSGLQTVFGETHTVYMTPLQKVHLYLESKSSDNLRHMTGGRTFANKEIYSKGKRQEALAQGKTIRLAPETVKALVKDMTPEELELAKLLENYYNKFAAKEINRVSNILYGYDKAMAGNYAPIFTNRNYVKSEIGTFDMTAEGVGNLKERKYAINPSYNLSAFDAFERHVEQTARFVGMAIPARNWNTLLSWREKGNSTGEIITHQWGDESKQYIEKLMETLQAGSHTERVVVSEVFDKVYSNYISAIFGANFSIVLKQLGSVPLAGAYLDWKNMPVLHPKQATKPDKKLIAKYTPTLAYRLMGYATPETKDLKNNPNWTQTNKITKLLFGGGMITGMDGLATSTLWPWAEIKVRKDHPELEMGTQEEIDAGESPFYKKVAELFDEAVTRTQSVSDEIHQSTLRKDKNPITRAFTMFRSDSAQAYNVLRQKIGEAQYLKESGASEKEQRAAVRQVGGAFLAIVAGYLYAQGVTLFINWWKHKGKKYRDDEDKLTAESIAKEMAWGLLEDIAGLVVGGSELAELIGNTITGEKWYGIETPGVEQAVRALETFGETLMGGKDLAAGAAEVAKQGGDVDMYFRQHGSELVGLLKDAAFALATNLGGIPVENVEAYLLGFVKHVAPEAATAYEDALGKATKAGLKDLKGAALEERIGNIFELRTGSGGISEDAVEAVAELYAAGYTDVVPSATRDKATVNGEEVKFTAAQRQTMDKAWAKAVPERLDALVKNKAFLAATQEEQEKAIKRLYDYGYEKGKTAVIEGYELPSGEAKLEADDNPAVWLTANAVESNDGAEGWLRIAELPLQESMKREMLQDVMSDAQLEGVETATKAGFTIYDYCKFRYDLAVYTKEREKKGEKTLKEDVLAFIDKMPISWKKKDALYFAMDYGQRDLKKAPWN